MKIIYIIGNTELYGSVLHLYDLIKKTQHENGIKLIAFSNGPLIELVKKDFSEIEIVIINVTWLNGFFKLFQIRKEIKKYAPDIVHSHQPIAILWGSISSKICFQKHIGTIHSLPYGNAVQYSGYKQKLVYVFHCLIQFISEALSTKSIFITNYNKSAHGYFKKKAVVIYNWVSDRFDVDNIQRNKRKPSYIHFLSICSINKGKGVMELLENLNKIKNRISFKLTIIGEGDDETLKELQYFITNNNLQKNIHFAGYQSNLAPFFNEADYFVLLTKGEAFGLVFVEAMRFGMPVICTNLPQLKEIIPPGNIFVDLKKGFDDSVIEKIIDNDHGYEIGLINMNKAKDNFNIDNQIKRVLDLYLEVFNK